MQGTTRRSLLAGVGISLAAAGCLSDAEETGEATTRTSTQVSLRTETTETSTPENPITVTEEPANREATAHASKVPDADHAITLRSEVGETRVRVRVVREETGEVVFETTETTPVGGDLYNLREADPEGIETFRICAELVGSGGTATESDATEPDSGEDTRRRDCATIRTSACYADAHVTVEEDGSVSIVYAIC
ncbi:hypothetical protein [Halorussus ruber]|uniref:hypothetical protein n=1 Tax=Halorussus ruber TaxID=1126238 RepID=UPI001092FC03|nr:hypothetical protein [Halorussus ruber]